MLLVVDEGIEARQRTLFVLRLVTGLRTLDEDLFGLTGIRILPHITQTHSRFYLVHILSSCTGTAEGVPFDLSFVDMYFKLIGFGEYGNSGSTGMHTTLGLGSWYTLHAVYT